MGITMSVASFGQFAMLPIALGLINGFDWQAALILLSILAFAMLPLAFGVRFAPAPPSSALENVSSSQALRDALGTHDLRLYL